MATGAEARSLRKNRLLATLSPETYAALQPQMERVSLPLRQVVYEPNQPIEYIYFPETGVISLLTLMADGTAVEVGTVGNEGMVGIPVFLDADRTPGMAMSQVAGQSLRLPVAAFRLAVNTDSSFQRLLSRYTQALFVQSAQSVACNRLHSIEERCSRWLLMTHDCVEHDHFVLTQEFLAQMLGVRRASVNLVSRMLQQAGLIQYRRGQITILDRLGLEATSCECYGIIKAEYDRLLA